MKRRDENDDDPFLGCIALPVMGIITTLGLALYLHCSGEFDNIRQKEEYKKQIISEIRPYIEGHDGKQGISFEDKLDFAQRMGTPTSDVVEGQKLNFKKYKTKDLEKALETYVKNN